MNYLMQFDCPRTGCFFKDSTKERWVYYKHGAGIFYKSGNMLLNSGQQFYVTNQQNLTTNVEQIQQIPGSYQQQQIEDQQYIYNQSFQPIIGFTGVRPYLTYLKHQTSGDLIGCLYQKPSDKNIYYRLSPAFQVERVFITLPKDVIHIQTAYISGQNTIINTVCDEDTVYKTIL